MPSGFSRSGPVSGLLDGFPLPFQDVTQAVSVLDDLDQAAALDSKTPLSATIPATQGYLERIMQEGMDG